MRNLLLVALAVALVAAAMLERTLEDTSSVLGAPQDTVMDIDSSLPTLGAIELIHNEYEDDLVVNCPTSLLSATITNAHLSGVGTATIVGATFHPNTAKLWVNQHGTYSAGKASFTWWAIPGCTNNSNPAGQVILLLSTGETYAMTIIANPI